MCAEFDPAAHENRSLRHCINDLVSVLALPAVWTGGPPYQIVKTLLDALLPMLKLDVIYFRPADSAEAGPVEIVRFAETWQGAPPPHAVSYALRHWLGEDSQPQELESAVSLGDTKISIASFPLGMRGESGFILAGSRRASFPELTERLVLNVAANQAAIGLHSANILGRQKRLADELEQRVAERTVQLEAANEDLQREIAERRLAEARLLAEEIELKRGQAYKTAILNSSLDCIIGMDHEGHITEFNSAAERTFGYRSDDVLGKNLADVLVPASLRANHHSGLARYLETGESHVLGRRVEMTALRADGIEIPVEIAITRTSIDGPPSFTGFVRDISEAKQRERELRDALAQLAAGEERWRSVFENSAIGVALTDANCRFIAVNPVYQRMLGYTEEELQALSFVDITHEKRRNSVLTLIGGLLEGKRPQFQIEEQFRHKDGKLMWVRSDVSLVPGTELVPRFIMALSEDITESKQAEEALAASQATLVRAFDEIARSEAKLRQVIDAIPALAWCNLPDGSNEFLSRGWHEYTGLSPEASRGWGWGVAFHPEDLPPLMEKWREMLISGDPGEIECRLRRYDGVYRWFLIRAEPFRDEAGEIVRWYGTSTDIDDRKHAEQSLRDSEQSSRLILDGIAGLVSIMSATGEVQAVNRQALEYFGKTLDELKSWMTTDAVHPDDLPNVRSAWSRSVASAAPYDVDHRLRGADGAYRWFHARGLPLHDAGGLVVRWYVLLTDIDDRRRAEEALQAGERELNWIVNTMPALAWSARPDGSAEFFNHRYLTYVGLPLEQLQGSGWTAAIHPDDLATLVGAWQSMTATGKGGQVEGRLRRFDGEYRWFLLRTNPMLGESGEILKWYGTNVDIDDRKRAEEELRDTQAELSRVTRAMTMGQLTASIAHEVNQPLSGVVTNAGTCLRMLDAQPPNWDGARETARRIIRDGNRASDVITRLRTLYTKKEPALESMDLNEATREVITLSLGELQKNGVTLRQELVNGLPPAVGDRVQLQQVILNLLRNAADAMSTIEDRPRELLIRTESDEENQIRLSVKDSGVGIPRQSADKIFQAFYTTKPDGMGIGLSVSRSIIEAHQGRMWATPNDGPGCTFSFAIPCGLRSMAAGNAGDSPRSS
jgi:PAS domain S-box-containing protein